jgi:hypothetical protein
LVVTHLGYPIEVDAQWRQLCGKIGRIGVGYLPQKELGAGGDNLSFQTKSFLLTQLIPKGHQPE